MKSSDEPIDEALRKALKRKFDDFEVVPHPDMLDRVMGAINSTPFAGKVQKPVIIMLVVAITITSLLLIRYENLSEEQNPLIVSLIKPGKTDTDRKQPATVTGSSEKHTETFIKSSLETPAQKLPAHASESNAEKKAITLDTKPSGIFIAGGNRGTIQAAADRKFKAGRDTLQPKSSASAKTLLAGKTTDSDLTTFQPETKPGVSTQAPVTDVSAQEEKIKTIPIAESFSMQQLLPRPYYTAGLGKVPYAGPDIEKPDFPDKPAPYHFLLSVTPLNTFQKVTILPQTDIKYQNFILPSAVSAQTLGFKVDAGIEKKGFQLLVDYSRFSQVIHYEIATEEYNVEPAKGGDFNIVRQGIPVSERTNFNMLGLSLQKVVFFKSPALRGYFGKAGVTMSHALSSSQNAASGNIGIGKTWKLSRNTLLVAGPEISYSFTKLKTNNEAFLFRPYQLGLSVGLKFIKH
ncbi:hypothetical protein DYBT9275_03459 [Dyadobacter sp. CECT 9275]|uniref:Uncharacterized protein n=1 Tax=Dyadobacter helix TaxID=2822344 RepID=A0A916N6Q6_9BACT|nr:hypothetical protein [Dyadobacter sp. CECT 9275]CAG5004840.1 hypothetical protein DYBT9275_03459 [Dyadobacter sp. CECT 9275]